MCPGRSYTVVGGDTLFLIAQRFLGDGTRWGELTKPDGTSFTEAEAENLQIGQVVCIPGQPVSTPGTISVQDVDFTLYSGGGDINAWIAQACQAAGLPLTDAWVKGFQTLCFRESSSTAEVVFQRQNPLSSRGLRRRSTDPRAASRCQPVERVLVSKE